MYVTEFIYSFEIRSYFTLTGEVYIPMVTRNAKLSELDDPTEFCEVRDRAYTVVKEYLTAIAESQIIINGLNTDVFQGIPNIRINNEGGNSGVVEKHFRPKMNMPHSASAFDPEFAELSNNF